MACVAAAMQLAGCVPIPYRSTDDLPNVVPHLPAPFRDTADELLVLPLMRKYSSGDLKTSAVTWHLNPGLLRPSELAVLQGRLASTKTGMGILVISMGGIGGLTLSETRSWLDELCLISQDGQAVSLTPPLNRDPKEAPWVVRWKGAVSRTWRTYVIQLLVDADSDKGHPFFSDTESACLSRPSASFHRFQVDRSDNERKRVVEFLNRIPVTDDAGPSH